MTLSDKIQDNGRKKDREGNDLTFIPTEDVKEFIQKLKDEVNSYLEKAPITSWPLIERIDGLAGPALIHSPDKEKVRCGASSSPATEDTEPEEIGAHPKASGSAQSCAKCGHDKGEHGWLRGEQSCILIKCKCKKFIPDKKGCGKLIEHRIPTYDYHCGDIARDLCEDCKKFIPMEDDYDAEGHEACYPRI